MARQYRTELSVDLYELTMSQVFWRRNMDGRATFSLFFRGYPNNRGYYIAAGIEQALDFLQDFQFSKQDIEALRNVTPLDHDFTEFISGIQFTGDVRAVEEGTIVFADEPLLEVTGNLIEAQIRRDDATQHHHHRVTLGDQGISAGASGAAQKPIIDFGTRRTHGEDAAIQAARSGYIAGFAGTSNIKAAAMFGIPAFGTMAHSFVQAFEDEERAFTAYVEEFPQTTILLVDTYDTLEGVAKAVRVAKVAQKHGSAINAIRLDSGNLSSLARSARTTLDVAGLKEVQILASGGLDEFSIDELVKSGAPIDAFGVGTRYGTSADAPYIDSVYKLVEIDGRPVTKLSSAKMTRPWAKQVFRRLERGLMNGDIIARRSSPTPEHYPHPLLRTVMKSGQRLEPHVPIETVRRRVASNLETIPPEYRELTNPDTVPIEYSRELRITYRL